MTEAELMRAVVDAARELRTQDEMGSRNAAEAAMNALFAILDTLNAHREPEPAGEVVEVRQAILWSDEKREAIAIDPSGLKDWSPGYRHIGCSLVRMPIPTLPTIAAEVE